MCSNPYKYLSKLNELDEIKLTVIFSAIVAVEIMIDIDVVYMN